MRLFVFCAIVVLAAAGTAEAQDLAVRSCGTAGNLRQSVASGENGGIHITARGTLRVLVVFASFSDDETPHPYWPAHHPPLFMQQFIDPDTTTRCEAAFNLTNYFRQMSLNQFHLIGEAVWVESKHSQLDYSNGSYGRANWSILQEEVDPIVDFSHYDAWTNAADYINENVPDSVVDMIIMVWRTTIFPYVGEASLGHKPAIILDGKRIEMGFPENYEFPVGSGVTCEYRYSDDPGRVMRTIVHELSHWLLGGPHPYNDDPFVPGKHSYWGMICDSHRLSSCANSYEREKLGWIQVPAIVPDSALVLFDYITTGAAFKYHPVNGEPSEYLYFENHQHLSVFDDVSLNPDDKGLWILHQQGPYIGLDNLRIRPSDGNWVWNSPGIVADCSGQLMPLFVRGAPQVNGASHRDQLPTSQSLLNWMTLFRDQSGQTHCGPLYGGQDFTGAFSSSSATVFSPYSNPSSNTWDNQATGFSLEVRDITNGVLTFYAPSDPLAVAPARRYLGIDPTTVVRGPDSLALAWGAQWDQGQPVDPDVEWSELERLVGTNGAWSTVYQGPSLQYTDAGLAYDSSGTIPVMYRARVRDLEGKYSTWSNVFTVMTREVTGVDKEGEIPRAYALEQNWPNPWNPSTTIGYTVGGIGDQGSGIRNVKLTVYNVLGQEVAVLVNEKQAPGRYQVRLDGSRLASGVYLYRLQAGNFVETKRMMLLK